MSVFLISASLHGMFVLHMPASASDVRRNGCSSLGSRRPSDRSPGPPMCAISISKPSPFTVIIPSKAIVK